MSDKEGTDRKLIPWGYDSVTPTAPVGVMSVCQNFKERSYGLRASWYCLYQVTRRKGRSPLRKSSTICGSGNSDTAKAMYI